MRYYLDTEFDEQSLTLISVGLVDADGRKFYGVNLDYDWSHASEWLHRNVRPHLYPAHYVLQHEQHGVGVGLREVTYVGGSLEQIASHARQWARLDQDSRCEKHEFWAFYADYDWTLFRRMFGTHDDMPPGMPLLCFDLKQLAISVGAGLDGERPPEKIQPQHCALANAEWDKLVHEWLISRYGREI